MSFIRPAASLCGVRMLPDIRAGGRRGARHTLSSWGRFSAAKAGCFAFSAGGMSTVSSTFGADAGAASRLRAAETLFIVLRLSGFLKDVTTKYLKQKKVYLLFDFFYC